jgi:type IV pilus assembly protein PilE
MHQSLKKNGFTLIELMVTIAIIGILAAIAIPNYSAYVQKSKITDATSALAEQKVAMERWYQDNRNYGSTASACGPTLPSSNTFNYSCNWGAGATNQSFTMTATGRADSGMSGFTFTIDHNNAKSTTAFPGASGLPKGCWISKKADSC